MDLRIRFLGDPILRERSLEVGEFDDPTRDFLKTFVPAMFDIVYKSEGVGLSAPQVGLNRRVIVAVVDDAEYSIVDPEIVESGKETVRDMEACLSIPGFEELVERFSRVVVKGFDIEGEPLEIVGKGLLARVLQHEIDHLDGKLILDHVSYIKRDMFLRGWKKKVKRLKANLAAHRRQQATEAMADE